jgi:hypothetical protein
MSKLKRIQSRARELARSGTFYGWPPLEFELRFEDGYVDARQWLRDASTRDELDALCQTARQAARRYSATDAALRDDAAS